VCVLVERRADSVRERTADGHQAARVISSLSRVRGMLWFARARVKSPLTLPIRYFCRRLGNRAADVRRVGSGMSIPQRDTWRLAGERARRWWGKGLLYDIRP